MRISDWSSDVCSSDLLVVGNPANTNALIAQSNAKKLDPKQFTAMVRLDHNRARSQLAATTGSKTTDISKMIIWGNHSATQYPDILHTRVGAKAAVNLADQAWAAKDVLPAARKSTRLSSSHYCPTGVT